MQTLAFLIAVLHVHVEQFDQHFDVLGSAVFNEFVELLSFIIDHFLCDFVTQQIHNRKFGEFLLCAVILVLVDEVEPFQRHFVDVVSHFAELEELHQFQLICQLKDVFDLGIDFVLLVSLGLG